MHINTAAGPISPDALGKTLMHEHLIIGMPGWETDTTQVRTSHRENVAICLDKIAELQAEGISSLLDPCPNDLGRDVPLMAEVAAKTSFNIIFATGLYHEQLGAAPYWRFREMFDPDIESRMAELFITELTEGVGGTGIKAGVIKVATHAPPFTDYEKKIFRAAARASNATGAPITTHTDGVLGEEQIALLTGLGVPVHKIIVGHSCGSADHAYHRRIVEKGAYIGFDRFGAALLQADETRVECLTKLVRGGHGAQIVVSHDCVWCWRGKHLPAAILDAVDAGGSSLRFSRVIVPMLRESGLTEGEIDALLIDNPRRYFAGEPCGRPIRQQRPGPALIAALDGD